jgi:hypothetical protein
MKTLIFLLNIFIILTFFTQIAYSQSESAINTESLDLERKTREMAVLVEKSTVFVMIVNGSALKTYGSGFIVAEGYIVTSGCLFSSMGINDKVMILNNLIKLTEAKLVAKECGGNEIGSDNLALLKFQPPQGAPIQPLIFSDEEYVNYWVAAWGYQAGIVELDKNFQCLKHMEAKCLKAPPVAATNGEVFMIDGDLICHTAQIDSGNFGGPLVTGSGKVVGINSWNEIPRSSEDDSFPKGLAIPSVEVVNFLKKHGVSPKVEKENYPPKTATPSTPKDEPSKSAEVPSTKFKGQMDLGSFTLNIPLGWRILEASEDSILIVTDDELTTMAVISNTNDGKDMMTIARGYSKAADGTEPKESSSSSKLLFFDFENNGKAALAFVFQWKTNRHFLVYVAGNLENPDIKKILEELVDSLV